MAITSLEADPCQRAVDLKAIRDEIITGGTAVEVEFQAGNGTRRHVKYSRADLDRLDALIAQADDACAIASGKRASRYALGNRTTPLPVRRFFRNGRGGPW